MYARLRQCHLIGAIGGFLTVLTAIISLAVSTSYYISTGWIIIVNMLLIGSNGLIATYYFGAFSVSRDSLIKVGSLIAGIVFVLTPFSQFSRWRGYMFLFWLFLGLSL